MLALKKDFLTATEIGELPGVQVSRAQVSTWISSLKMAPALRALSPERKAAHKQGRHSRYYSKPQILRILRQFRPEIFANAKGIVK